MTEQRFRAMLQNYRDALSSKEQFSGQLKNYFPNEPMIVNLMVRLYEMGIFSAIEKTDRVTKHFRYRFVQRLVDEHGTDRQHAESLVGLICVGYGKEILGKPCDPEMAEGGGAETESLLPVSSRTLQQGTMDSHSNYETNDYPSIGTSEILSSPYYSSPSKASAPKQTPSAKSPSCPRCNLPIEASARFCRNCGQPIQSVPLASTPQTLPTTLPAAQKLPYPQYGKAGEREKWLLAWILGVVAVGVMITVAIIATGGRKITLSEDSLTLYTGDTKTLSVTIGKNNTAKDPLIWSSSNTGVATVADDGTVTAVGAGEAIISVSTKGTDAKKITLTVNPNVYVAGSDGNRATLWKNGVPQQLPYSQKESVASAIFVFDKDVYVVGHEIYNYEETDAQAILWKNGVPKRLKEGIGEGWTTYHKANSVYLYGGNVFVAGHGTCQ